MFDVEKLIEEVAKRPCLWKSDDKDYNCREVRRSHWEEIGNAVYSADWKRLDYEGKQQKLQELQKKWKSVRDYYKREQREYRRKPNQSIESKRKRHTYFYLLKFLDNSVSVRRTSSRDKTIETDDTNTSEPRDEVNMIDIEPIPQIDDTNEDVQQQEEQNYVTNNITHPTTTKSTKSKKRKLRSYRKSKALQEKCFSFLKKIEKSIPKENEPDEDKMFLLSLLPEVRQLSKLQKLDFRLSVINSLKRIQFPYLPPSLDNSVLHSQ